MTNPLNARDTGSGRHYTDPTGDDPERLYISVTNAIKAGSPKYLDNWYKKLTAESAVYQRDEWLNLPPEAAVDWVKRACDRHRDLAAAQGTEVHAHMEGIITGQPPLFPPSPPAVPYVAAGKRFLDEWAPTFLHAEVTVYNDEHGYAGTADGFVVINLGGTHIGAVLDYKTGKNIYPDAALQLAALRHADRMVIDGVRHPMPDLQAGVVVHLRGDGTYRVHIVECGGEVFADFVAVLEVARVMTRLPGYMGKGLAKRPAVDPALDLDGTLTVDGLVASANVYAEQHPDFLQMLAESWPPGLPTLRQARQGEAEIGPAQLAIIAALIDDAVQHVTPFPEGPPPTSLEPLHVVRDDQPERASVEAHEAMIARLQALPEDLLLHVSSQADGKYPNLRTRQFTPAMLAELDLLVVAAEVEQGARFTRFCAALGGVPSAAVDMVLANVGIPDADRIELAALERLEAFARLPISGVA